jgi:hypothetical protein
VNEALVAAGVGVHALVPERHSLEDVFLSLVEEDDADAARDGRGADDVPR